MVRDILREMFAPTLTDEELASYSLATLRKQIAEIRASEPDDSILSDHEIAVILKD
jgi:DNA-directed RNA polymerase specialized sigma54-like protein